MAIIKMNFLSRQLKKKTNVLIYLPTDTFADYKNGITTEFPGMKYQVLWLLHGGGGDDTDFHDFSNILYYAEQNKIAVVMPAGENFYLEPHYTYVTEELPGRLRLLLPFSSRRGDNFIAGLSYGGDCAMRAAMEHPDRYGAALILSAAGTDHHGDAKMRFDVYGLAEQNLKIGGPLPELIFGTGNKDSGFPYYEPIINKLDEMGLPIRRYFADGDGHSWPFWDGAVKRALEEWFPIRRSVILPETSAAETDGEV